MAKNNETTIKFKVDITDLKKNIQEAQRQIKLANAEFKAASAGMGDWSKSADGLSAKISQLQKTLSSQKSILADYKKQLELVEKEYGANSKEADEMRVKVLNQEAAVKKTESALQGFEKQLNDVEKEEKEAAAAAEKQAGAYNKLEKEVDDQQKELNELKNAYKQVVIEQGKDSQAAQELAHEIDDLSGELKENKDAMREADKAADELDKSLDDIDPEKPANGFTVLKGALASLAADAIRRCVDALKEFAAATLEVGKNFDSQMSKVEAISGATADEVERLRDKAKEMGSTTKFTATEAGEAFEYMAMAGWKTEEMLQGIDGIMNLAAASGAELGTTSDIVTDALTAFGYSAADAGHFADILAAAATNSNTNVEMMGASFKYVAPLCGSLGYSAEDAAIALGLMANSGIKADMAGTSLRNVLQRMAKPTKESAEAMDILGVSLYDDSGRMYTLMEVMQQLRVGIGDVQIPLDEFNQLCEELDSQLESGTIKQKEYEKELDALTQRAFGAEKAEQARAMAMLGGARALSGLLAISNASEKDFNDLTNAIYGSEGAAEKMAATMLDNLGGDMTLLKSKLEGVQLSLYEKFEPALRDGVAALSKLLDVFQWLIDHGDGIAATITGIATAVGTYVAYTTALKLMQLGWTGITAALKASAAAQWLMNAAMAANPIGIIIAAVVALIAVFVYLWKHSEKFRNFWIKLWQGIKIAVKQAVESITKLWNGMKDKFTKGWDAVKKWFTDFWAGLKLIIEPVVSWFTDAWTAVSEFFAGLWDGVKEVVAAFVEWYYGFFIEPIINLFKPVLEFFATAWQIIKELGAGCWEVIKMAWSAATSWFNSTVIEPVKQAFTEFWDGVTEKAKLAWDIIKAAWIVVSDWFAQLWDGIKTKASEAWEGVKAVWAVVSEWFNATIITPVKTFFSDMWNGLKEGAAQAWEGVKAVFTPIVDWFREKFRAAWEAVKKVFSTGGAIFKGIQNGIVNAFKAIVNGIIRGINRVIAVPFNAINNTLERIRNVSIGGVRPFAGVVTRFNVPQIPLLARGGVLARGQVGLLEGNGAEAVVPLDQNRKWIAAVTAELKKSMQGEGLVGGAGMIGGTVYNFVQNNTSPKALSRLDIYRQTQNQLNYARGV